MHSSLLMLIITLQIENYIIFMKKKGVPVNLNLLLTVAWLLRS